MAIKGHHLAGRYRRALSPVWAVLVLIVAAEVGHLWNAEVWWGGGTGVLVVVGLLALRLDRHSEVIYAAVLGVPAALWECVAWMLGPFAVIGPFDTPLALIAVGGGAALAIPWWRHQGIRNRITVIGGTMKPWRWGRWITTTREKREAFKLAVRWPDAMADAKGPDARIRRIVVDDFSRSFHVEMRPGETYEQLVAVRRQIESALDAQRDTTSIELDSGRARDCVIRWAKDGCIRPPLVWTGPSGQRFKDPILLGEYDDRTPLYVSLVNQHALVGGTTGAGKTSLLRLCVAEQALRTDTYLIGFDVAKRAAKFHSLRKAFARLVVEDEDVVPTLQAILRGIRARGRWNAEHGHEAWPAAPSRPQVGIVVDEVAELVEIRTKPGVPSVASLLVSIARLGRELGVYLLLATQRPSGEALGNQTELRSLLRLRIALPVTERMDGELILGLGTAAQGWDVVNLQRAGRVLVRSPEHPSPRPAQSLFLSGDATIDLADILPPPRTLDDAMASGWEGDDAGSIFVVGSPSPSPDQASETIEDLELGRKLDELLSSLRKLGPTASMRRLARATPGASKSWIHETGLPTLAAQGRVSRIDAGFGQAPRWVPLDNSPKLAVLRPSEGIVIPFTNNTGGS